MFYAAQQLNKLPNSLSNLFLSLELIRANKGKNFYE